MSEGREEKTEEEERRKKNKKKKRSTTRDDRKPSPPPLLSSLKKQKTKLSTRSLSLSTLSHPTYLTHNGADIERVPPGAEAAAEACLQLPLAKRLTGVVGMMVFLSSLSLTRDSFLSKVALSLSFH